MAPKKGNKHGVGYGRPPNEGFSDEEVIELVEEMLAWMKAVDSNPEEKYNAVHLSQFYSQIKGIAMSQWKSLVTDRKCFLPHRISHHFSPLWASFVCFSCCFC